MPITADIMDGLFDHPSEKSAESGTESETDSDGRRRRKRKTHTPHDAAAPTPEEAREGYEMPQVD